MFIIKKLVPSKYGRGRFESQLNFGVCLLAATIGLGDVLRFPNFILEQKESSFLVPFFLTAFIIGIPLVAIELFLGQFTSAGPATCWEFSPIFRGVGIGSLVLTTLFNIFYQVDLAISVLYTFKSFAVTLPWKYCDREWATDFCIDFLNVSSANYCRAQGWNVSNNGACYNETMSPRQIKSLWNLTLAGQNKIRRVMPVVEYFKYHIQGVRRPGELYVTVNGELLGCLLFVWFVVSLALMWGLNSLVRVMYFAVVYTFAALITQLIFYSVIVDGAWHGVKAFFEVNIHSLASADLWLDAANQAFFTLSMCTGVLLTLASFNSFRRDCIMFASVMAGGNVLASLLAGCITFGVIGSLSKELHTPIVDIYPESNLGFVVYPQALLSLPWSAVWSGIFFFMIFVTGASSLVVYVNAVYTALLDGFPLMREYKNVTLAILCSVYCPLGILIIADVDHRMANILRHGLFSFNIFVLSFLQCIALAWVYGIRNFLQDMSYMIGDNVFCVIPWKWLKYGFALSWTVLCPIFTGYNTFAALLDAFAKAGSVVGVLKLGVSCITLLPVAVCAVQAVLNCRGTCLQKLISACRPTEGWGPVLPKMRRLWLASRQGPTEIPMVKCSKSGIAFSTSATIQVDASNKKPAASPTQVGISSLAGGGPSVADEKILNLGLLVSKDALVNPKMYLNPGPPKVWQKPSEGSVSIDSPSQDVMTHLSSSMLEGIIYDSFGSQTTLANRKESAVDASSPN
ncbi:hypothetical protein ACOMHN_054270 [Nucella lapillus]